MKHVLLVPDNGTCPLILGETNDFPSFMKEHLKKFPHLLLVAKQRRRMEMYNPALNRRVNYVWVRLTPKEYNSITKHHAYIKFLCMQKIEEPNCEPVKV